MNVTSDTINHVALVIVLVVLLVASGLGTVGIIFSNRCSLIEKRVLRLEDELSAPTALTKTLDKPGDDNKDINHKDKATTSNHKQANKWR